MIPDNLDYRYDRRVDSVFSCNSSPVTALFRTLTEYALKARYPVDLQFRSNPKDRRPARLALCRADDCAGRPLEARLGQARGPSTAITPPALTQRGHHGRRSVRHRRGQRQLMTTWTPPSPRLPPGVPQWKAQYKLQCPRSTQASAPCSTGRSCSTSVTRAQGKASWTALGLTCCVPSTTRPCQEHGRNPSAANATSWPSTPMAGFAVEVKPKGVSTIVWAPAQAIVYARLLHLWTRNDPQAAKIISGMISQRQELHLLASRTPRPVPMPEVLPVVAVQRGMSQKHRERLFAVRHHLQEHGIEDAARLQIYEVTLAGRLLNADRGR